MKKVLFLFGELNDDDIDWLISQGSIEKIDRGTILIQQGQKIDRLYVLLEGTVSVSVEVIDGSPKEIALLGNGEVFGELSFMDTRPPSASVITASPSILLSIRQTDLTKRLYEDVGFASRFYKAIAVFLSCRLRSTVRYLGYDKDLIVEPSIDLDDIDEYVLNNFPLAEARYDWILRRLASPDADHPHIEDFLNTPI